MDAAQRPAPPFPRLPLFAAGTIVGLAILAAAIGRITGAGAPTPTGTAVVSRDLRFVDRGDGGVTVYDAHDGRAIELVAPATNGFLRATMRGLAVQRRREGLTDALPFHLTAWQDGRLTLDDPATHRRIDLESFGQTNEGAFADLLGVPLSPVPATLR